MCLRLGTCAQPYAEFSRRPALKVAVGPTQAAAGGVLAVSMFCAVPCWHSQHASVLTRTCLRIAAANSAGSVGLGSLGLSIGLRAPCVGVCC